MIHAPNREARIRQDVRGTQAMLGDLRPPPAPRITCNCGKTWAERMVAGTGSGNRAGKIPSPTVGVDSFNLGGRGAPKDEVAFLATSGANLCGYGSGAGFAGSERFAQRPGGSPPRGAAASCPNSA